MPRTSIDKAIEAAEHPNLLETPAQLQAVEREWSRHDVLGMDTEFLRERTYRAELGLVQVSDGRTAWLWDPLRCEDAEPIVRLLRNPDIIKVVHSGSEDLEVLLHALGTLPEPLVDTQVACAMLGQPLQLALQGAVRWLFDFEIEKDQTRSNWLRRPLRRDQLRYAAMDVVLLPRMLDELRSRLEAAGRWNWLTEDVGRMLANAPVDVDPAEAYLRIGGAGRLDDPGLRVLRALARWREHTALARNRARGFVVSDAALLDLARMRPGRIEELSHVEHLHPRALARYGSDLLTQVGRGVADHSPVARPEPLDDSQRRCVNRMRDLVQRRAKELQVDPALLASRRELERLVRAVDGGEGPPERFQGWRKAVITDELLELIG